MSPNAFIWRKCVWTGQPAESPSIRRDVDAAVRQVGGDGHKLVDESCSSHQSEGVDQFVMISYHT